MVDDRCRPLRGSPTCGGRERRQPGHGPRKGGLNTKSHPAADAHGMPVRALVTRGATADCARAIAPTDGFAAERLLADKGYDTDEILAQVERRGMEAVIPSRKNRREQRDCDKESCRARYPIESAFLHFEAMARHCDPAREKCGVITWLLSGSDASFCGLQSRDYTI